MLLANVATVLALGSSGLLGSGLDDSAELSHHERFSAGFADALETSTAPSQRRWTEFISSEKKRTDRALERHNRARSTRASASRSTLPKRAARSRHRQAGFRFGKQPQPQRPCPPLEDLSGARNMSAPGWLCGRRNRTCAWVRGERQEPSTFGSPCSATPRGLGRCTTLVDARGGADPNCVPPDYWCDKLPVHVSPWVAPRYKRSDLAIGIYTGEDARAARIDPALAMRRSEWRVRLQIDWPRDRAADRPHAWACGARHVAVGRAATCAVHIAGGAAGAKYRCRPAAEGRPDWVPRCAIKPARLASVRRRGVAVSHLCIVPCGRRYRYRGAHYVQLNGLADLYHRFPTAKWYYIVGCDTCDAKLNLRAVSHRCTVWRHRYMLRCRYRYVNLDYALRMLDAYNASEPWWVANVAYPPIRYKVNVSATFGTKDEPFPNRAYGENFVWTSGAHGWWLSNPVAKAFAAAWPSFDGNFSAPLSNLRRIAASCIVLRMPLQMPTTATALTW